MPSSYETERDNAGPPWTPTPVERKSLLGRLGLTRSKPIAQPAPGDGAMAVVPLAPYVVGVGPQVGPLMPMATGNAQLGRFLVPYGVPTQVHAMVAGVQLRCGVETVRRQYLTSMAPGNPAPFFQQTVRPNFPVMTTRDGGRPGNTLGPAGVATTFGPARNARARSAEGFAAGLLGW